MVWPAPLTSPWEVRQPTFESDERLDVDLAQHAAVAPFVEDVARTAFTKPDQAAARMDVLQCEDFRGTFVVLGVWWSWIWAFAVADAEHPGIENRRSD
jgi:hypothetical protein